MSQPRAVFAESFLFLTRNITQRQFLLRPDDITNNNYVYCLAEAAQRFGIQIIAAEMMSNHDHLPVYDPHGRRPEFEEHFRKMLARCQNSHRGRSENMWSSNKGSVVRLEDRAALIDKVVYTFTNSVKAGLVERAHHWPGPAFLHAFLTGRPIKATRPKFFFSEDGVMPETVELKLGFPAVMGDMSHAVDEVRRRIHEFEEHHIAQRARTGKRILGRANVKRQSPFGCPENPRAKKHDFIPRVATRNKWRRIAALQRDRKWQSEYARCREKYRSGDVDVVFPAGTYWLKRFIGVAVAEPGTSAEFDPPPVH